jgi:transcriptional regulator with XRE-family HTH domain
MTQGERIREIRKANKLTVENFGKKIGMGKSSISQIENGVNALTIPNMKLVCKEFNISEDWLRDGIGEMYAPAVHSNDKLSALSQEYNLSPADCIAVEKFLKLTPGSRQAVLGYMADVTHAIEHAEAQSVSQNFSSLFELSAEFTPDLPIYGTVEEEEAAYKKSILDRAEKTGSIVLNTIDEKENNKRNIG